MKLTSMNTQNSTNSLIQMEGDFTSMNNQKSINSRIQMKVGRALLALSFALFLAAGGTAQAAAWYFSHNGTGWVANEIASGAYVSVADRTTSTSDSSSYAAQSGGNVNIISGGVSDSLGLSTNYKSLSSLTVGNAGYMWGVNTSGGVDYINYFGGWASSPLVSGSYLSVSANNGANNSLYASKSGGGIDYITYTGGAGTGWGASSLLSTASVYVDLAPQHGNNGMMWGVTAAGAINRIDYSSGWGETAIVTGNYISVANAGANGFAYGARADGGIDYITYTGGGSTGWGASSLLASSTVYNDLAADLQMVPVANTDPQTFRNDPNGFFYASSIPEPSTLSAFLVGAGLLLTLRFTRKGRVQG